MERPYLSAGPTIILDCYKNHTAHWSSGPYLGDFAYRETGSFSEFVVYPLKEILELRGFFLPYHHAAILDLKSPRMINLVLFNNAC